MAEIKQKFSGDATALEREIDRLKRQYEQLADKQSRLTKDSRRDAESAGASTSGWAKKIGGLVAGYLSLNTVMSAISSAVDDYNQKANAAVEASTRMARAHADALKNMAGMDTAAKRDLLNKAPEIALRTGFADSSALVNAIGAGVSAGGTDQAIIEAVTAAAMLTRLKPEQLGVYAAGAIDLSVQTGFADAQKNISFLLSTGRYSRITDPKMVAEALPKIVGSAVSVVPEAERERAAIEAAAVFATLTKSVTDTTGQRSTTAGLTMLGKLDEFFRGREGPATVMERVRMLQSNEQLREEFLAQNFGEVQFKTPFRQLLTAGSPIAMMAEEAERGISFDQGEFAQQARESIIGTVESLVETTAQKVDAVIKELANDPAVAFREVIARGVQGTLANARTPFKDSWLGWWGEFLSESPVVGKRRRDRIHWTDSPEEALDLGISMLEHRLSSIQSVQDQWDYRRWLNRRGSDPDMPATFEEYAAQTQTRQEAGLEIQIEVLKELRDYLKAVNFEESALKRVAATLHQNLQAQSRSQDERE